MNFSKLGGSGPSRLSLLCNHLAGSKEKEPVYSSLDYCFFDDLLTPEQIKFRKEVREFAEKEIVPHICEYYEKAEFPEPIVRKLGEKNWFKPFLMKPYGEEKSQMSLGLLFMEIARADASMATTMFPVVGVIFYALQSFGTEEQKKTLFPDLLSLKKMGAFCLTEENVGSDATNIQTIARKVPGGYELEGNKRWPGSATKDLLIVFAREENEDRLEGFIVPTNTPGVKIEKIKNKLSLRCVENCHITFNKAFVPDSNKLITPRNTFMAIGIGLATSRLLSGWLATGIALGVYDNVIKYLNNRTQFGVKITAFQLTQEKLARMMGHIQAMLLLVWRVTKLFEERKMTAGMASMAKAWTTNLCREVVRLGREMLGGNGIISDNYVMRALVDLEGVYTYEGTYDINVLLMGRELTGISAFKPNSSQ